MPLFDEDLQFISLDIPVSQMREDLSKRYHVHLENGQVLVVDAGNAAEAVAKLGVTENISRISNVGYETRKLLERDILDPLDLRVATDISLDVPNKAVGSLVVSDTLDQKEETPFAFMNLVEYADENALAHPDGAQDTVQVVLDLSAVTVVTDPLYETSHFEASVENEEEAVLSDGVSEALSLQPEECIAEAVLPVSDNPPAVEQDQVDDPVEMQGEDRELSPEEVRQLLQG